MKLVHDFVVATLANYDATEDLSPPPREARLILTPIVHEYAAHIGMMVGPAVEVTAYVSPRARQSRQRMQRASINAAFVASPPAEPIIIIGSSDEEGPIASSPPPMGVPSTSGGQTRRNKRSRSPPPPSSSSRKKGRHLSTIERLQITELELSIALKKAQYHFVLEATKKLQGKKLYLNFGNIEELEAAAAGDEPMEAEEMQETDETMDHEQ